jgi:hypothetical protein
MAKNPTILALKTYMPKFCNASLEKWDGKIVGSGLNKLY